MTWLFPFLHPWVTGEESKGLDDLAVLRIHLSEGTGNRVADGNCLGLLAAALDDHVQVELVRERESEERCEHVVLKLDGRQVFFEAASVDDDLAGAFGHPDAGDGGFAAASGALSSGGGHLRRNSGLFDGVGGRCLGFVRVGFTCIDLELAELGAAEAGLRDHTPDCALDEQDRTTLADDAWSLDFLATDIAGETGVNLGSLLGAGKDNLVSIDDDDKVTGINVGGENWLVLATEEARSLNSDLAEDLALGVDHIPLALDFMRLGGKRLHVLVIKNSFGHTGCAKGSGN